MSHNKLRIKKKRLSRKELFDTSRAAIFDAAGIIVGEFGYKGATIKRITEKAGIAQGTFYIYFSSRQELFDNLLPYLGSDMVDFVRIEVRKASNFLDMEEYGFRAFFKYLKKNRGFMRILNEAESAAPAAYYAHFKMLGEHYHSFLVRQMELGSIKNFNSDELEAISYMLMGSRSYTYIRYFKEASAQAELPEEVVTAYMKLVHKGLRQ